MSRKGNRGYSAVSESIFATLKTELGERFERHSDAQRRLFETIEDFYNGTPRHSAIGHQSPSAFERLAACSTGNPSRARDCLQTIDPIHKS